MAKIVKTRAKKLTDAEQYKRFREMGEEIGASKDPKAFDKAFKTVTKRSGKTIS